MLSTYALIRGPGALRTIQVGRERALPIFESVEAAEDFLILSGSGPEWEVADGPRESFIGLLREKVAPSGAVRYVTVNPPASLRGGESPAVELIPIERFIEG
jgi:hypothetical protein